MTPVLSVSGHVSVAVLQSPGIYNLDHAQVAELVARPLRELKDGKELAKVVREAVREAVNEERAVRGLQPTSLPKVVPAYCCSNGPYKT